MWKTHNMCCMIILTLSLPLLKKENALAGDVPTGLKKLKHLSKLDLTGNRFDRYSLAECRISLEKHLPNCVRNV